MTLNFNNNWWKKSESRGLDSISSAYLPRPGFTTTPPLQDSLLCNPTPYKWIYTGLYSAQSTFQIGKLLIFFSKLIFFC